MHRLRPLLLAVLLAAAAACQSGPATDTPSGVARTALDRLAAGDVEGLRALACEGAEDEIADQLGMPGGVGGELLPGLDTDALFDAVEVDVSELAVEEETITGDTATVQLRGDLGVSFDPEALRPIVRSVLEAQGGGGVTDAQVDALVATLGRAAQDVPISQELELVREDGAWRLCGVS